MLKEAIQPQTGDPEHHPANALPRKQLEVFFRPKPVALIGATDKPDHVGRAILSNVLSSPFGGTIYPLTRSAPRFWELKRTDR